MFPLLLLALSGAPGSSPEERAVSFLAREVPAWSSNNKCYSCHNNGNGARALFIACRLGYTVPEPALADTVRWLAQPGKWNDNPGDQPFNDETLARFQFALALLDAVDSDRVRNRKALSEAASTIAARQLRDGSWNVGPAGRPGSATTLGMALATAEGRRLLAAADAVRYREALGRADQWLRHKSADTVADAAAILLALGNTDDEPAMSQRKACLALVARGQAKDGGWGPYVNSSPEVFDTALVVLALRKQPETEQIRSRLQRGRDYLVRMQQKDGSWPETTRPAGGTSYAERISTTSWATRALLATPPAHGP